MAFARSREQACGARACQSPAQPLLIRVDSREHQSPVPALLATFPDVTLSFAALPSADYLLSDDVAVERKTASDFVASILDRRLFGQTTRMKVLFPRAMLIIEGDLSQVPHSIDMEAIRGALAFLTVREGITVLQVNDATETAAMLRIMARHAQERMGQPVSLREPRPQIEELYAAYLGRRTARDWPTPRPHAAGALRLARRDYVRRRRGAVEGARHWQEERPAHLAGGECALPP